MPFMRLFSSAPTCVYIYFAGTEQTKMSKTTHAPLIDSLVNKITTPSPAKISVKVPRSTSTTKIYMADVITSSSATVSGSVTTSISVAKTDQSGPSKFQKMTPVPQSNQPQKTSGLAISAIGERLMAARQRPSSGDEMQPIGISEKIADTDNISSSLPKSGLSSSITTDHVKVLMESPMSPDITVRSPAGSHRKQSPNSVSSADRSPPTGETKQSESKMDCSPTTALSTPEVLPTVVSNITPLPSSKPVSVSIAEDKPEVTKVELHPAVSDVVEGLVSKPSTAGIDPCQISTDKSPVKTGDTDAERQKNDSETMAEDNVVEANNTSVPVLSRDSDGNIPSPAKDKSDTEPRDLSSKTEAGTLKAEPMETESHGE